MSTSTRWRFNLTREICTVTGGPFMFELHSDNGRHAATFGTSALFESCTPMSQADYDAVLAQALEAGLDATTEADK